MAIIENTPAIIADTENMLTKQTVTSDHWNARINQLITQGNINANTIQTLINALSISGAAGIGTDPITGVTGTTVQAMLLGLKTLIDLCYTKTDANALLAQKQSIAAADTLVKTVTFNPATGVFTITTQGGTVSTIDTAIEKIAVNFAYNSTTQALDLTLADGSKTSVPLSSFITETEFVDSNQVDFSVTDHKVTATIKNGSITLAMLESTLLTTLQGYATTAQTAATNAAASEANTLTYRNNANTSATNAAASATGASGSANAAAVSATAANTAKTDAVTAKNAAESAKVSAETAATTAGQHKTAAENAVAGFDANVTTKTNTFNTNATDKTNAFNTAVTTANATIDEKVTAATTAATNAGTAKTGAEAAATTATVKATESQSWAVGGTSSRASEDTNNAKYWAEQAESLAGGVLVAVGDGFALNNGSTRPTLGEKAVDLSYAENSTKGATGYCAYAEGIGTTASFDSAHAEGYYTTASGASAHAEGLGCEASGEAAHAEGASTIASGDESHAGGLKTVAQGFTQTVIGRCNIPQGTPTSYTAYDLIFIVGNGDYDTATHKKTSESNAFTVDGAGNAVVQKNIKAASATIGSRMKDSVVGSRSVAEGTNTTASGANTHAEGVISIASGHASHAEGTNTTASSDASHAEGKSTIAYGKYSHAEGWLTVADGDASHAEGFNTKASGYASHSEGVQTTASGRSSHAEGEGTTASGMLSHAEGNFTTASGAVSHASGLFTTAQGLAQTVIGMANVPQGSSVTKTDTDFVFIIGNGVLTQDPETQAPLVTPSNALTLDWLGNLWTAGAHTATQLKLSALNTAPASATDTGVAGEIRVTADYIYVCVAENTWKRTALTTW